MLRRAFALVLPAVLVACGGASNSSIFEEPAPGEDVGVASDSAVADSGGTTDSTTPVEDTESPPPPVDSGTSPIDSGTPPPEDTGVLDTGIPFPFDTGTPPPVDAGVTCTETGGKTYLGHCYFPISSRTFTQARDACVAAGAHLVTITSAGEQSFVNTVGTASERWIGLAIFSGSSSWRWITSEPMTYMNWDTAAGEPNGSGYCARLRGTTWADIGCNSSYPAVCERE